MRIPVSCASLLLALLAVPAFAQPPRLEAGVQAGPALSWMRGNSAANGTDPLLSAAAGATFAYDLSTLFGVRIGAGYQRKGARERIQFTDVNGNPISTGDMVQTMDYIIIPVTARLSFGRGPRGFVAAGPYFGGLLQALQSYEGVATMGASDLTDSFERWDVGFSAGAGVSFKLAKDLWLNVETRFDKGLVNVSAVPVVDDGVIHTSAVCLLVGCSYRFGPDL